MSTRGLDRGFGVAAWCGAALWLGLLGGVAYRAVEVPSRVLAPSNSTRPSLQGFPVGAPASVATEPAGGASAPALCSGQPQRFVLADPGAVHCNPGAVRLRLRRTTVSSDSSDPAPLAPAQAEWLSVQGDSLATGLRLVVEPAAGVASRHVWQLGEGRGGTYQLRHRDSGGWLSVLWDGSIEQSPGQVTSWSPQLMPYWILQPVLKSAPSARSGAWLTLNYWTSGKRLAVAEAAAGQGGPQSLAADALPTAWLVSPASDKSVPWTQQWRLEDVAGQPCRLP